MLLIKTGLKLVYLLSPTYRHFFGHPSNCQSRPKRWREYTRIFSGKDVKRNGGHCLVANGISYPADAQTRHLWTIKTEKKM